MVGLFGADTRAPAVPRAVLCQSCAGSTGARPLRVLVYPLNSQTDAHMARLILQVFLASCPTF